MDEEMGSEEINPSSIHMRRSPCQGHSVFNSVDARREVTFALQLSKSSPSPCVTEKEPTVTGNTSNYGTNVSMYCYSLLEAMPLPGPTWSTTAPSVLAEPPLAPTEAFIGLEWEENQASSYTWWLEFLEGLDGNMTSERLDHPFVENIMESSKVLRHESSFVDSIDLSCCPDDWLMIPTVEKDLGDMVMP